MDPQGVSMIEVVIESEHRPPPAFSIGQDDDWKVEWRSLKTDDEFSTLSCEVSREPFDSVSYTHLTLPTILLV